MQLARSAKHRLSSNAIRQRFLDFFIGEKGHRLVRSSPVLPHNDPTLAFCNAGMNQFKSVLLGTAAPPAARVANSQKCCRVGGKHNDLADVGADGTHHTFFEMLGNWSFGDYFKKDACEMAWELLTKVYGLESADLYVTYFGGEPALGLAPDLETRDIWRSIGVAEDRLLAGSSKDNFWEMGETGPCGGCTEIHYLPPDTMPSLANAMELWNLVFIEFRRDADGSLHKLDRRNVDTGMGFERLVSVLQGANSNYDTDLFMPLFHAIHRSTGRPEYCGSYGNHSGALLDTAYRVLADHCRMITVCLADGFYPDQENKLRGIIRKALTVSREVFDSEEKLLVQLSTIVADILQDAYPEICRNLNRVHHIITKEGELLRSLRKSRLGEWDALCRQQPELRHLSVGECPNLLPAYHKLREAVADGLPTGAESIVDIVWKICETYGVPQNLAHQLASSVGLTLDENSLEKHISKLKMENRKEIYALDSTSRRRMSSKAVTALRADEVPTTDDSFKYAYLHSFSEKPEFPAQSANIVALLVDGDVVEYASPDLLMVADCEIGVILDRTNMYSEAGGQAADRGCIYLESKEGLSVEHVSEHAGYVLHWIQSPVSTKFGLRVNDTCSVTIDTERRNALMRNHTATHLLNAALRKSLTVVDQKSSRVYPHKLSFDFSVYRENLTSAALSDLEMRVQKAILHGVAVKRRTFLTCDMPRLELLTTLPGETYHHKSVHVIEVDAATLFSREPCCGTHATNTRDLEDLVITNYRNVSSSVKSIEAVTGPQATQARNNLAKLRSKIKEIENGVDKLLSDGHDEKKVEKLDAQLVELSRQLLETELLSFVAAEKLADDVEKLRVKLKYSARGTLRTSMEEEMKQLLSANTLPYVVHNLQCASKLDSVPLAKAARLASDLPSLIFAGSGSVYKARCTVPQSFVKDNFSASIWMSAVAEELKCDHAPPKGQDAALVSNMKAKKLTEEQLQKALQVAHRFAKTVISS